MNTEMLIIISGVALLVFIAAGVLLKRRPKKINTDLCTDRWRTLQKHCGDKKSWHVAVTEADRLLDDVLKRRHYKGKSTGERLVSAQHDFSNNESLWFGHKLYNRIQDEGLVKLSKRDTLEALGGFRQALKDLGALRDKVITAPPETAPVTVVLEPAAVKAKTKSKSKAKAAKV